ncbi:sensor histidine kinase [Nocardia harenae]|uniref:sensor histidine kinase n=1 Tax=Nocardia harenae TaxID=358707 RepID=UPI001FDFCA2F|nr:ATP-binding protein [Nocardia harenae]
MSDSSKPRADEPASPGSRPLVVALLSIVVVIVGLVVPPGVLTSGDTRVILSVVGAAGGLLFTVAVLVGLRFHRKAAEAAAAAAAAQAAVEAGNAEAKERIAEAEHRAAGAEAMRAQDGAATDDAVGRARESEHRRAAAMAAFAGAAGRMQAMTTSMLAELREMEHKHADPKVLADLLHLDHRTAQAGRLADSIAVLSGARSGRRWAKPIAMESILRGAMGRVSGYQRVRLRAVADVGIAGHAAEGVMHALAELLDNACNFSPPTTEVHVYAAEVPAGVVVTIEDSGLVMSESALRRAEFAVSGAGAGGRGISSADLASLTGTRLGLAVVGHLARKHGLTVSYRPSAIGGTAVVIVVPRDLTARVDRTRRPQLAPAGPAEAALAVERAEAEPAALPAGDAPLPKRRRGSTLAAVHPAGIGADAAPARAASAAHKVEPSALGAFQRAVTGRDDAVAPPHSSPSPALENDR